MKIGDCIHGGIYAGTINCYHVFCSTIEYDLPYKVNWYQAVEYCKSIGMELPSEEELNLLYELRKLAPEYFPKQKYHWYWSSTEISSTSAWGQFFNFGLQNAFSKNSVNYVRAIRRIKI